MNNSIIKIISDNFPIWFFLVYIFNHFFQILNPELSILISIHVCSVVRSRCYVWYLDVEAFDKILIAIWSVYMATELESSFLYRTPYLLHNFCLFWFYRSTAVWILWYLMMGTTFSIQALQESSQLLKSDILIICKPMNIRLNARCSIYKNTHLYARSMKTHISMRDV